MKTYTVTCDDCGYVAGPSKTERLARHGLNIHSCEKQRAKDASRARRLARAAAVDKTPKPCLHKRAQHQHGTYVTYTLDFCRCPPCSAAATEYERKRVRSHAYGRFEQKWVDASEAREHVQQLMGQGLGLKRVVELSGYSQGAMTKLIYGSEGNTPSKRILREHADAILAVRATIDTLAGGVNIDGTGTRRRVQALIATGWSQSKLARQIGWHTRNFAYLANGDRDVAVRTARAIRDLYDRLWDVEPPVDTPADRGARNRSLRYAAARSWAPPLAWDDDTIDDPTVVPTLGDVRAVATGRPIEDLVEDIEWVLKDEPLATAQRVADRLGYRTRDAISQALRRTNRDDLIQQLARNARHQQEGTAA